MFKSLIFLHRHRKKTEEILSRILIISSKLINECGNRLKKIHPSSMVLFKIVRVRIGNLCGCSFIIHGSLQDS
ncbi:hypothetical protein HanPSC8_Chr04g0143561 [Helianthus annuus]|nr:hypothetical protein HanPSC8_Chr04g0143561 [Helianthus annuus]